MKQQYYCPNCGKRLIETENTEDITYSCRCGVSFVFPLTGLAVYVHDNWEQCGIMPIMVTCLVQEGWTRQDLIETFAPLLGDDMFSVNMTTWIDRLEAHGYKFPIGKPVFKVLKEILIVDTLKDSFWGENI